MAGCLQLRSRSLIVLALITTVGVTRAALAEGVSRSYRATIVSKIQTDVDGQKRDLETFTELTYTWQHKELERTLSVNHVAAKASVDGTETSNISMDRAKVVMVQAGQRQEVTFENAPKELQEVLGDSFDTPICKIAVNNDGKEVQRTIVAGPGAKTFVDSGGMIAVAVLFHSQFLQTADEWPADAEVSMGHGGYAKGKLTYTKIPGGNELQAVKVAGILTNEGLQIPNSPMKISSARYVVSGEQLYNSHQHDWVSGKRTVEISYDMTINGRPCGSARGTMSMTFENLSANR